MKSKRVALPRPKGTRKTSRVAVTITMHPARLAVLEARAAAASMSLTAYLDALLDSDGSEVAPRTRNPRINWLEDNSGATVARRCARDVACDIGHGTCVRPHGHEGACSLWGALTPPPPAEPARDWPDREHAGQNREGE